MKLKYLSLVLFVTIFSGCVTVQDKIICSPAGVVSAGAICSHTNYEDTSDLDFGGFIDFLEARPESDDVNEKSAAVCMSAKDYSRLKIEVETMCRMLGNKCAYEIKK